MAIVSFLRLAFYSPPVTARPDPRPADLDAEKARVLTFDFDTP